jgi:hypothetical protein
VGYPEHHGLVVSEMASLRWSMLLAVLCLCFNESRFDAVAGVGFAGIWKL